MKSFRKSDSPSATPEEGLKSAAEIALERADQAPRPPSDGDSVVLSRAEHDRLRSEAAEHRDQLLRAQAELENFRKRMAREKQDWMKFANERLLGALLTPLDHFEMGLEAARQSSSFEALREGMELVQSQFREALRANGVAEIEAVGKPFDPSRHEAVAQQESESPEGQIVRQLRKGYSLNDRILRATRVIVSKGSGQDAPADASADALAADEAQEI
ncbi:MAG: nucleotide exchange factor GrpE [Verrucomicrobiae bacterium]|nr:nucleotide exchange factor GrpE [Verrucomicrobiae bacterium]